MLQVLHVGAAGSSTPLTNEAELAADHEFSVDTADTAEAGLRAYDADCLVVEPPLDTDIVDFLSQIRERDPELPILLFASPEDTDVVSKVLATGADYVPKTDGDNEAELLATRIETLGGVGGEH